MDRLRLLCDRNLDIEILGVHLMTTLPFPKPIAIAPERIHPQTAPGYLVLNVANIEHQLMFETGIWPI